MPDNAKDNANDNAKDSVIDCAALVIGAGPVGLFQVFQLGLQDIRVHMVDALPEAGGQCIELYADKPIYDIPAVQVCTGRELVQRLMQQVAPFAPQFHLGQEVTALAARDDGRFDLQTSAGTRFVAGTVFIAAGVGAFQARALKVEGAERHAGRHLLYRVPGAEVSADRHVLVVGGEEAAVQAVLQLAAGLAEPAGDRASPRPASITLLHRRRALTADPGLLQRLQSLVDNGTVRFEVGQVLGLESDTDDPQRLVAATVVGEDGSSRRWPADLVLAFLGVSPKLGPVAQWGLALERRQLVVDAAHFETSVPGIYAVGDVVTYPGKKKLILCGFHEATLAAFAAAARLRPEQPVLLQYTTTSPRLHQLLGVATPGR
ncbi:MAG: NAD(P)/FAD-dependent oxidoreductase [Microbacteriaceae bacterium]|nr:NAD(P)/FAD-dependent oxidoreductase [Burkholderiaceae bacterium]